MAQRPLIRLRLSKYTYAGLSAFSQTIHDGITGNAHYATPSPTMPDFQTAIDDLNTAITAWGPKGNRGSHATLVDLRAKVVIVKTMLTQLAEYVQNLDPYDDTFWIPVGFEAKNPRTPQGILQAVQNLHNFISHELNAGEVKLKWKKPLNVAVNGNVKMYKVYRNNSPAFNTAAVIGTPTKTTITDTPPAGTIVYYWVVAVNNAGDGVTSDVCLVTVPPAVI